MKRNNFVKKNLQITGQVPSCRKNRKEIMNLNTHPDLPVSYATTGSAGFDIRSTEGLVLHPMDRRLVSTGLFLENMPEDMALLILPKSGLAIKNGITVLNSPGLVDQDFKDEIKVILINLGEKSFDINPGDKIAQGVFQKVERPVSIPVADKVRTGGFGSTGV